MRHPDWTMLHSDLIERIGRLLIADDLTDFIRLRAVCHSWRASTEEIKSRVDCLYPRNWIVLSAPQSDPTEPWCIYNPSTHKSFSFDLTPYLEGCSLLRVFVCGFLMKNHDTEGIALVNPFMRSVIQMPKKIESKCAEAPPKLADIVFNLKDVFVTRSGIIVFKGYQLESLIWTRPGDQKWVYDQFKVTEYVHDLFYEDRIYAIDDDKGLVQIDFSNEIPQPQVEVIVSTCNLPVLEDVHYLVGCGGDIILVCGMIGEEEGEFDWGSFEVYRLHLKEKRFDRTRNLGNHSIFLDVERVLSVSCANLSHILANSIYVRNYSTKTAYYNLSTNEMKIWPSESYRCRSKLIKEIVSYCQARRMRFDIYGEPCI